MKVELSLHAIGLKNIAGAFKGTSDPFAVVTHVSSQGKRPQVLGQTEVVKNTLNPNWVKVFLLDYEMGTPMKVVVSIFDEVRKGDNKPMGSAVFDIGELLGVRGNTKAKKLRNSGTVFAHVRKSEGSGLLRLSMSAKNLTNTEGFMRKSDPFYEISRQINAAGGATFDNVFRSNVVEDNLNPTWETSVIDLATLCGGDLNTNLRISVFDNESSGKHVLMGQVDTTVKNLSKSVGSSLSLQKKGKGTGSLHVSRAELTGMPKEDADHEVEIAVQPTRIEPKGKPSFLDYVSGGCELNVVVAIDFTGSNGNPRDPGTLHHIDANSQNSYEKAISSIVEILAKYDTDKNFPVVGFGAKYDGVVQHCFQCGDKEEVHGVKGVLDAYESVFRSGLIMSGPTVFTEVMQTAAARAQSALDEAQAKGGQAYTILLIVSDGAVTDVQETAECLKQIADTPLSVVIVGVGDADFSSMEFLDDLPGIERDLAQFVEFNKHPHKFDLTSVTLREIPDQVTQFFEKKGISPGTPVTTEEEEIVVEMEEEEIDLSLDIGEEEIVVSGGTFASRGSW